MVIKNNLVTEDKDLLFNDLMLAKNKDLMYMVYQPQYDLDTKEIVGMESLLRYKSEEYELFTGKTTVDKRPRTTKYLRESWNANTNIFLYVLIMLLI